MANWHDFDDLDFGSLTGTPSRQPPTPKQRESKVKKYIGLLPDPAFGFKADPGTLENPNKAPEGINPHEWSKQQDAYFFQQVWNPIYNRAYKMAFDGEMHLGNLWALMPYNLGKEVEVTKGGWKWGENDPGLKTRTEKEYREHPFITQQLYHDEIINAVKRAQQDRKEYDDNIGIEKKRWGEEDEVESRTNAIRDQFQTRMAEMRKRQEERAQYQQAFNVASQARQARMANIGRQRFAADPATGRASGGEAASAKLLTHRGLNNEQKLGSREKLGKKSLLGV